MYLGISLGHRYYIQSFDRLNICACVLGNREILTGDIPYAGLTPLQAAIGVVQRYVSISRT